MVYKKREIHVKMAVHQILRLNHKQDKNSSKIKMDNNQVQISYLKIEKDQILIKKIKRNNKFKKICIKVKDKCN